MENGAKRVEPLTVSIRRPLWSLLQTQWLDVPIAGHPGHVKPTWGAFSEVFEDCLQGVYRHVSRRVGDRAGLQGIVTGVFVENLDVLVSQLGTQEKLRRLLLAADVLIARRASPGRGRTDGCPSAGRFETFMGRKSDA